jgi:demethylmenaquinone methyltransferase/2-methoxy-6-polyprenyl-1,4-benzoquinol methylase
MTSSNSSKAILKILFFDDNKFDAVCVGFGVRNFENLEKGLKEFHRVLRPGGTVNILEFSRPGNRFVRSMYNWYSSHILPRIGSGISGNENAYRYLHDSIEVFPSGRHFLIFWTKQDSGKQNASPLRLG